jgi:hypothetical protein
LPQTWADVSLGQAAPISADAAALADYDSPNQTGLSSEDLDEDPELARLRGTAKVDDEVHMLLGWTTREGYPLNVGISLPIRNWVGEGYRPIQFWEEVDESLQIAEHHAATMYGWLCERLAGRSQASRLPAGMPDVFQDLSVTAYKNGRADYILYEPLDSLAGNLTDMPVRVQIEYRNGYTKIGMGDAYSLRMLAQRFWTLTHNEWNLYPQGSSRRCIDGTIVHETSTDPNSFHKSMAVDRIDTPPVKIQKDQGRGTAINSTEDHARLLQYWAWARQEIAVGVALNLDNHSAEYWLKLVLDPLEDDDGGRAYPLALEQLWLARLRQMFPQVAAACESVGTYFGYQMRYQGNVLKVWYAPNAHIEAGLNQPLAEIPTVKDKWIHQELIPHPEAEDEWLTIETVVLTYPPMKVRFTMNSAKILFGPQARLQERYPDPEAQGGKIALIASNNNIVQKPPNSLDRMHASLPKQVAYNQRVLSAEDEIAGINCDVAEFLSQLSPNPGEPVIVCVKSGESLKRHEECLGGQLWIQGDRQMTATNKPFEGMSNDSESDTLAGGAEAVEWVRVLEDGLPKRTTQRVVAYSPTLTEFSRVLSGDCSNLADGHEIAYQLISVACSKYEAPPAFYSADSQDLGGIDPSKVPLWMHTAACFQLEVVDKYLKMVPMFATLKVTLEKKTTVRNWQGCALEFQSILKETHLARAISLLPNRPPL